MLSLNFNLKRAFNHHLVHVGDENWAGESLTESDITFSVRWQRGNNKQWFWQISVWWLGPLIVWICFCSNTYQVVWKKAMWTKLSWQSIVKYNYNILNRLLKIVKFDNTCKFLLRFTKSIFKILIKQLKQIYNICKKSKIWEQKYINSQQVENREILHIQIYQIHKVDFQKRNKIL